MNFTLHNGLIQGVFFPITSNSRVRRRRLCIRRLPSRALNSFTLLLHFLYYHQCSPGIYWPVRSTPNFFLLYRYNFCADDIWYGKYAVEKCSVRAKIGFNSRLGGLVVYVYCTFATSQGCEEYFRKGAEAGIQGTGAITAAGWGDVSCCCSSYKYTGNFWSITYCKTFSEIDWKAQCEKFD